VSDDTPPPWRRRHKRHELDTPGALADRLEVSRDLAGWVVQGLDLSALDTGAVEVDGAVFLGCSFGGSEQLLDLVRRGAAVFPRLRGLPYDPYRVRLYTVDELLEGYEDGGYAATRDFRIYAHFDRERHHPEGTSLRESLAQRLHDHGIDDALEEALETHRGRGVVGIMGGHGTARSAPEFREVARIAWELTRAGFLVAGGGGPGVMEAANLGAYLSAYARPEVLDAAIAELSVADRFDGGEAEGTPAYLAAVRAYFQAGRAVVDRLGPGAGEAVAREFDRDRDLPGASLAVPTWFYGHEPTNLFATHVAKYFANGLREDGLLAIATAGVVYAPGSAGTLQEVFMDLAQNHYATFAFRSPMVFLGRERYRGLVDLVRAFVREQGMETVYGDLIALVDGAEEAVAFLEANPPRLRPRPPALYELPGTWTPPMEPLTDRS